jgi:predicted ATP-grasp superfamily ATP-dependent carboligase
MEIKFMAEESFSVLIPDGESDFALFVAHCLAPFQNVRLHVLSNERWAPIRFSRYCHTYTFEQYEPSDESRLDTAFRLIERNKIDVLLPTGEEWIAFVASHREVLSRFVALPPLPDPACLAIANNKWLFAQFLEENDIPGPTTILVTCDDHFEEALRNINFPVLIKPVEASGGHGIMCFEKPSELKPYLEQQELETLKERYIVQSFITGSLMDANILSRQGEMLAITLQKGIICDSGDYVAALALKFFSDEGLSRTAHKLVSTLNWSGYANIDTLYDHANQQFKILEINARFWGSLRGSFVAGVSFPYLACLAALEIPFTMPEYQYSRYFHSKTALREIFLRPLGKNRESSFDLRETGLWFLMTDPIAEGLRGFSQEVSKI